MLVLSDFFHLVISTPRVNTATCWNEIHEILFAKWKMSWSGSRKMRTKLCISALLFVDAGSGQCECSVIYCCTRDHIPGAPHRRDAGHSGSTGLSGGLHLCVECSILVDVHRQHVASTFMSCMRGFAQFQSRSYFFVSLGIVSRCRHKNTIKQLTLTVNLMKTGRLILRIDT